MEKQLAVYGFWLGLLSGVIGVVIRALAVVGIWFYPARPGGLALSFNTFHHGAELLFLMAIASTGVAWLKNQKS